MRLYLVRHGRTPSNVDRLLDTAVPGAELDEVGRRQAEALVVRLAGRPVEAVYASDLTRTQQTVAPLAAERTLDVTVLGGLREIQAGEDEMSPDWRRYVDVLEAWGHDLSASVPGGEDAHAFLDRFDGAVATIAGAGHDTALAASHGAALRMWVAFRATGIDVEELIAKRLGNTAIITLDGDPASGWTFVDWEEASSPSDDEEPPTPDAEDFTGSD